MTRTANRLAGEELERQLDRFVRVRLDPSPAQAKRARSAVMEAAWRQRLGAPATASEEPSVAAAMTVLPSPYRAAAPSRGLFGGWSSRRLGASFAAAMLAGLMLGTSAFASSRAGGPLYETRLALEELDAARRRAGPARGAARARPGPARGGRRGEPTRRSPARSRPPSRATSPRSTISTSRRRTRRPCAGRDPGPSRVLLRGARARCRRRRRPASRTRSPRAARSSSGSTPPRRRPPGPRAARSGPGGNGGAAGAGTGGAGRQPGGSGGGAGAGRRALAAPAAVGADDGDGEPSRTRRPRSAARPSLSRTPAPDARAPRTGRPRAVPDKGTQGGKP